MLSIAGGLAWWILSQGRAPRPSPEVPEPEPVAAAKPNEPQWQPRERTEPTPGCEPRASRVCLRGDAWWVDSCEQPHEKATECGLSLCDAGECEPPPADACGGLPAIGRCEGDIAEVCAAGRPMSIDCSDDGMRCVMSEDGPLCRPPSDTDCDWPAEATRCDGDTVLACRQGRLRRVDCAALNARCVAEGTIARCVAEVPPGYASEGCGPCGCSEDITGDEVCDGRDNDGDGYIDEDGCDPIDIVALVITDARGNSSYTPQDLQGELTRINKAFTREDDYGLTFRLADTLWVPDPELLETDEVEFDHLTDSMAYPPRENFYIPILFTDKVSIGSIPRPGASTVPNGACGGKRRDPAWHPPIGLIGIAKRRWPTTVAHEIGHFLGLCHTHGDHIDAVQRVAGADEGAIGCDQSCVLEADGICDTPPDPGPLTCTVGEACTVSCQTGEVPDGHNLMGYYPECRSVFSVQQSLLMRQSLALRRGWHRCAFGAGCACEPTLNDCPSDMSCRALAPSADGAPSGFRCAMDGASVPGGTCRESRDCSEGAACMVAPSGQSLCIRPCNELTPRCDCREVPGNPWPICFDDATRGLPG